MFLYYYYLLSSIRQLVEPSGHATEAPSSACVQCYALYRHFRAGHSWILIKDYRNYFILNSEWSEKSIGFTSTMVIFFFFFLETRFETVYLTVLTPKVMLLEI